MSGTPPPMQQRRWQLVRQAFVAHARAAGTALTTAWVVTSLGAVVLPIVFVAATGLLVDAAVDGRPLGGPLLLILALEVASTPAQNLRWRLVGIVGWRYRAAHRQRLIATMIEPPGVAHVFDPEVADVADAADNVWVSNMMEGGMHVAVTRLLGVGGALLVTWHDPVAGVVLAAAWLVVGRWAWQRATQNVEVVTGQTQALRRSAMFSDLALTPQAAKEIRLFGLSRWVGAGFVAEWRDAMAGVWAARRGAGRGWPAMGALLLGAHLLVLGRLATAAAAGGLGIGDLSVALQGMVAATGLGSVVFGHWEIEFGFRAVPGLDRLEQLVAARVEALGGDTPAPAPRDLIRFEGVSFSYAGGSRPVLDGLDLDIAVGTSLAIVGDNGAGKTTMVQLLCRLRDPSSGRITVDGADLATFEPRSWQHLVAAVSQAALRLPFTARENVAAGRPLDDDALRRVAELAGVASVVDGLPRGWETPMSREFGEGADLSGGQWQRLALARALASLETGAEILVLDEPTAHLDVRGEAELYDRFLEVTRGRTTVLVSHRFSTVRRADRIVVLDGGRVVEEGTHDELVARDGRYATMFRLQADRFGV